MNILREETTFGLCNQAKVEAISFNNRYLDLYERDARRRGSIKVTCHWRKKFKEA